MADDVIDFINSGAPGVPQAGEGGQQQSDPAAVNPIDFINKGAPAPAAPIEPAAPVSAKAPDLHQDAISFINSGAAPVAPAEAPVDNSTNLPPDLAPPAEPAAVDPALAPTEDTRPGYMKALSNAVERGVGQFQEAIPAFRGMYAEATGDEASKQEAIRQIQNIEAKQPEALVPSVSDIHSWDDATYWATERLGEQAPVLLSMIGTGGAGALAGEIGGRALLLNATSKAALKLAGTEAGIFAGSFGIETPNTATEQVQATGNFNPAWSVGAGLIKAGLESYVPFKFLKEIPTTPWAVEAVKTAGREFITEGLQEQVDILARTYNDPNYHYFTKGMVLRTLDSAAAGLLVGGTVSGVAGGAHELAFGKEPPAPSKDLTAEDIANYPAPPTALEELQGGPQSLGPLGWLRNKYMRKGGQSPENPNVNPAPVDDVLESAVMTAGVQKDWARTGIKEDQILNIQNLADDNTERYALIDPATGQAGSKVYTNTGLEEALALRGNEQQTPVMVKVDSQSLQPAAITADVHDIPEATSKRIYFLPGTTSEEQAALMGKYAALKLVVDQNPSLQVRTPEVQAKLDALQHGYQELLDGGLRVIPSPGSSFNYNGVVNGQRIREVPTSARTIHTVLADPSNAGNSDRVGAVFSTVEGDMKSVMPDRVPVALDLNKAKDAVEQITDAEGKITGWRVVKPLPQGSLVPGVRTPKPNTLAVEVAGYLPLKGRGEEGKVQYVKHTYDAPAIAAKGKEVLAAVLKLQPALEVLYKRFGLKLAPTITVDENGGGTAWANFANNAIHLPVQYFMLENENNNLLAGLSTETSVATVLLHELGHIITLRGFFKLPYHVQSGLQGAYRRALLQYRIQGTANHIRWMNPVANEQGIATPYLSEFAEWMAEQFRRYSLSDPLVMTQIDSFMVEGSRQLKTLYKSAEDILGPVKARDLMASGHGFNSYMEYLEGAVDANVNPMQMMIRAMKLEPSYPVPQEMKKTFDFVKKEVARFRHLLTQDTEVILDEGRGDTAGVEQFGEFDAGAYGRTLRILVGSLAYAGEKDLTTRVVVHEAFHGVEDVLTPQERTLLIGAAKQANVLSGRNLAMYVRYLRTELKRLGFTEEDAIAYTRRAIDNEYMAHLVEARVNGKVFSTEVSRILDKIIEMITRVMNGVRGLGFQTADDVLGAFYRGELTRRYDANKATVVRGNMLAAAMIDAWHGTPHEVEQFSGEKIGTGEGAQAYGYGLYFTANKGIAEYYKKSLARRNSGTVEINGVPFTAGGGTGTVLTEKIRDHVAALARKAGLNDVQTKLAASVVVRSAYHNAQAHDEYLNMASGRERVEGYTRADQKVIFPFLKNKIKVITAEGNLYKVTLDVNDEDLLDWDKPFAEQPPKVQAALKSVFSNIPGLVMQDGEGNWLFYKDEGGTENFGRDGKEKAVEAVVQELSGQDAYRRLDENYSIAQWVNHAPGKRAAEILTRAGVAGVRYLDGSSRGKGGGTHNYVVFPNNDKLISIKEKNGKEMTAAAKHSLLDVMLGKVKAPNARMARAVEPHNPLPDTAEVETLDADNHVSIVEHKNGDVIENATYVLKAADGTIKGYVELSFDPGRGYGVDFVEVARKFYRESVPMKLYQFAQDRLGETPKPSGVFTPAGYRAIKKINPYLVADYVEMPGTGFWYSPGQVIGAVGRLQQAIKQLTSLGKDTSKNEEALKTYRQMLAKIPPEKLADPDIFTQYMAREGQLNETRHATTERDNALIKATTGKDVGQSDSEFDQAMDQTKAKEVQRNAKILGIDESMAAPTSEDGEGFRNMMAFIKRGEANPAVNRHLDGVSAEGDRISWFSRKFFGIHQLLWRNEHLHNARNYLALVEQWNTRIMEWVSRADNVTRGWDRLPDDQRDGLSNFLFYLTEMNYRTPAEVAAGVIRQPTPHEFTTAALAQFRLTTETMQVYNEVQSEFDDFLVDVERVSTQNLQRTFAGNPTGLAAAMSNLAAEMAALRARPYFPMVRFGKYTITVRDPNTRGVEAFHAYSTVRERDAAVRQVAGAHIGMSLSVGEIPDAMQEYMGLPAPMLKMIQAELISRGASPAQVDWLDQIANLYSPDRSFRKRWLERKGTPGYSLDGMRAFASYFRSGARYLARLEYKDQMQDEVNALDATRSGLRDSTKRSKIVSEIQDHLNYIMEPSRDWGKLKSIVSVLQLGGSVAAAGMNLTQTPLVSYPYLAGIFGDGKSSAAFLRNANQLKRTAGYPSGGTPHYMLAREEAIAQGKIATGQAIELGAFAEHDNLASSYAGTQAQRLWRGVGYWSMILFTKSEQFNREWTFKTAYELALADSNNHHVVDVGTLYSKEIFDIIAKRGLTYEQATAFMVARRALDQTQFIFQPWARPKFLRSGLASTLQIFFSYTQSMLYMLGSNPAGRVGGSPEAVAMSRRQRSRMFLGLLLMYGVAGLPGAEDLDRLLRLLARKLISKDLSVLQTIRKEMVEITKGGPLSQVGADIVLHGLSRYSFGFGLLPEAMGVPRFDASANGGMGQIVPGLSEGLRAAANGANWKDFTADVARDVAGAGFGQLFPWLQLLTSDPGSAGLKKWEAVFPRSVKAMSKAYRYYTQGQETTSKGGIFAKFDVHDPDDIATIVTQALGVTPTKISAKWEELRDTQDVDMWYKSRRMALTAQLNMAIATKDGKSKVAAIAAIRNYNQEVQADGRKEYVINGKTIQQSIGSASRARAMQNNDLPTNRMAIPLTKEMQELHPGVEHKKVVK